MTPIAFEMARKKMGISQTELGDYLGLSIRQIRNLETGQSQIKPLHECALRWIAQEEFLLTLPYEYQNEMKI